MFAICVESSHRRGMGHFFRMLILYQYFLENKEKAIFVINHDPPALNILKKRSYPFVLVKFEDTDSDWESKIIGQYGIDTWLNDKFCSSYELCSHVKKNNILLAVIDDIGQGAFLADIHFAGMLPWRKGPIAGKHICQGSKFIILNPEIKLYRRVRKERKKLLISLGGSDTYHVTLLVVEILKTLGLKGDIVIGPSFQKKEELKLLCGEMFTIFQHVPSLIELFQKYDWIISGGGITCLEACASGLPCVVIANEEHEIYTAEHVEKSGCGFAAGYYKEIDQSIFQRKMEIEKMSKRGINEFSLDGCANIYKEICRCRGGR